MRRLIATTAALVLLAGCSTGGGGTPATSGATTPPGGTTSAAPTATSAEPLPLPSVTETTAPPAEETTEPGDGVVWSTDTQADPAFPGGGGDLLPVAVRVGDHAGFERVVLDFEGTGSPGWRVGYVDVAVGDPSGLEIDVDGDAILEVIATGVRYPEESEYDRVLGAGTVDAEETDEVEEIVVNSLFEGHFQAFIGLDEQRPFRVFTLTGPSRLVIDVQTG